MHLETIAAQQPQLLDSIRFSSLETRNLSDRDLIARDLEQGGFANRALQQAFAVSGDFTSCRSEFFPDAGGRGWESPASSQTRCFTRLHEGREIEPTGFTATRPIAGGTLERVVRVAVPTILVAGTALVAGGIAAAGISRIAQVRPPSTALAPPPPPEPAPVVTDQVFNFIRRNGIFLALGLGLFAFFRR